MDLGNTRFPLHTCTNSADGKLKQISVNIYSVFSVIHSFIVFNLQFNSADDDYKGLFKTLEFGVGVTSMQVNLQIYDDEFRPKVEGDESFSVLLRNSRNGKLSATHSKAVVTIHDLENDGKNIIVKKLRYSLFFDKNIK